MFSSWFGNGSAPPKKTIVRQQHVEVIGGGQKHVQAALKPPRLPTELSTWCAQLAAELITAEEDDSSRTTRLLNLARVCRGWYVVVFSQFVLPDVHLAGVQQLRCLDESLSHGRIRPPVRTLVAQRTRRLCITQGGQTRVEHSPGNGDDSSSTTTSARSFLYDFHSRLREFEKASNPYLLALLSHTGQLEELHLESTPEALRPRRNISTGQDVRHSIRRFSFLLSTFGGVGCEDIFIGLHKPLSTPATYTPSPWQNLTHLQISGPAGFRLSMSTSSSLGSLPSLTHLNLVMPNIVKDASMHGETSSIPAALQLLVLLLSNQLKELTLVGHNLSGYMGWNGNYHMWLQQLSLPLSSRSKRIETGLSQDMLVRLVTVRKEMTSRQVHPNHFVSWIVEKTVRGRNWEWKERDRVDTRHSVTWEVQEWNVPFEPQDDIQEQQEARQVEQERTTMSFVDVEHDQDAEDSIDSDDDVRDDRDVILGLDDLD
ncbi:unnamed protein product [Sympodiomycopsis kandeliae]